MIFSERMDRLRCELANANVDVALITDDDNIYYFTGYYDYLHMEFGRPTILAVFPDKKNLLITPFMEMEMAESAAIVDQIEAWNDGMGNEWREALPNILAGEGSVAIEPEQMPVLVRNYVDSLVDKDRFFDVTSIVTEMRMIKSAEELQLARHAAQVSVAMMKAGYETLGDGVPEYEVALAISAAGTHKSAELLEEYYDDSRMSPMTHFLQIMASGKEITMPHHRASTRKMKHGEPVFLCFCGMTNFHRFKLGFDRTFWIGEISDKSQADFYQVAVDSQASALSVLRPGVKAQEVHAAYAEVIEDAGFEYPFRCGRGTGFSFLEKPQLVFGDKTVLQPGMVLAVDGSVNVSKSFRAQVGDSFVITKEGYEQLTEFRKDLKDVIIN